MNGHAVLMMAARAFKLVKLETVNALVVELLGWVEFLYLYRYHDGVATTVLLFVLFGGRYCDGWPAAFFAVIRHDTIRGTAGTI